jgi:hypothetical protein
MEAFQAAVRPIAALKHIHGLMRVHRCEMHQQTPPTLEEFVIQNDHHLFDRVQGLARLIDRAEVRLVNQSSSLDMLNESLKDLDLADTQRLRPNWDQYFMQLASLAAQRSNCMKRRVGCVLVRERRVISTGYNGTPRKIKNCNEGGCRSQYIRQSTHLHTDLHRCTLQRRTSSWCRSLNLLMHSCRRKRTS